jgi:acyl transferase domain-containing protein
VLLVCPGRGSYDRESLGQLKGRSAAARAVIEACDAHRASLGRPTVTEIDGAERYRTTQHVAGEHASLLTFACAMADAAELDSDRYEVVGVTGNSMGWYTALAASGSLPLSQAIELVDTMGWYQKGHVVGGQLLLPCHGATSLDDPQTIAAIDEALASVRAEGHAAYWSIRLGGYAVLGADAAGLQLLQQRLPRVEQGGRTFPVQLPLHSAFHTPLMQGTSDVARHDLAHLAPTAPQVPLVDGHGVVHRPVHASPARLLDYTLGAQVTEPYDFSLAVRTALAHTGAEAVVVLGPGNSLGGPLARILVAEGWGGVRSKEALAQRQASDEPLLLSMGVAEQRAQLVAS